MEPHIFKFGTEPWPDGLTSYQVYAVVCRDHNGELWELLPRWRAALDGAPVTLLEDDKLHCTLDTISLAPADQISTPTLGKLCDAIGRITGDFRAYEGRAGSAVVVRSGPLLDISPAEPLWTWHRGIRGAVHSVLGPDSTAFPVSKPHLSLGYATAVENSDPWNRALRQVDPNGAPLRIDEIQVVKLSVDQTAKNLWWDTVEAFTLT